MLTFLKVQPMNKRFQDITIEDVAGMPAEDIEALIEKHYVPLERRRMAIVAVVEDYFKDIKNNRYD